MAVLKKGCFQLWFGEVSGDGVTELKMEYISNQPLSEKK